MENKIRVTSKFANHVTGHYAGCTTYDYLTRVHVEQWDAVACWWRTIEFVDVPAEIKFEPDTINKIGGRGAYRSIENTAAVEHVVSEMQRKHGLIA